VVKLTKEERREKIVALLKEAKEPLTGAKLSSLLGVTRQVIVSDIAVLRAGGENIIATSRGYLFFKQAYSSPYRKTVAVRHGDSLAEIAEELYLIVKAGGKVLDVTVEHPLYGELTANLQLAAPADVAQFVAKMAEMEAEPLLVLTDGYHLHAIEAPDAEAMGAIEKALQKAGYLVD